MRLWFISVLFCSSTNTLVLSSVSMQLDTFIFFYLLVYSWNLLSSSQMCCLKVKFFSDFLALSISVGWWCWRWWQWWGRASWTRSWREDREVHWCESQGMCFFPEVFYAFMHIWFSKSILKIKMMLWNYSQAVLSKKLFPSYQTLAELLTPYLILTHNF